MKRAMKWKTWFKRIGRQAIYTAIGAVVVMLLAEIDKLEPVDKANFYIPVAMIILAQVRDLVKYWNK